MTKEEALALWLDQWERELSPSEQNQLDQFLAQNPRLKQEWEEDQSTWKALELEAPEPGTRLDQNFYDWLNKGEQKEHSWYRPWQWAAAVALILLGFGAGKITDFQNQQSVASLSEEVSSLRQMMMLTLIELPKAQDRLKAVNISQTLSISNEQVLKALIATLQQDPNPNVRLAALDALAIRADQPMVREALVQSIAFQDNPLLQSAMADLMLRLMESSAKNPLEQIMNKPEVNPAIKEKIEKTIQQI